MSTEKKATLTIATALLAVSRSLQSNALKRAYHQEMLRELTEEFNQLNRRKADLKGMLTPEVTESKGNESSGRKKKQKVPPKVRR